MKNYVSHFPSSREIAGRAIAIPLQGIVRLDHILLSAKGASVPRVKVKMAHLIRPFILVIMYLLVTSIEKM